ncbi:nucleoside transporter [Robiginitalea myxolifaciens]|uniref:Nucleoside transporter n=1 Tax=Robiginitalea myxolifaciens TaxID=400055 RepID=A0A1I6FZL2_9FLAO|nr:MFS transporter [Robiginitalea myxolifaciens]SFR35287.1 nucleoside transporter [Robiginitalea myxolifaciens]
MKSKIWTQLSAMMFLEFFIWGSWFVTMGIYLPAALEASGAESALAYATQSWGAIVAPFIIGLIADRYFNAERIFGLLHLVGGVLMVFLARAETFAVFYPYVLGYMILYMPTLSLANSICFYQLTDPAKQFSFIRVFGTIGWILAGLSISFIFGWDSPEGMAQGALRNTFYLAAGASFLLGLLSFILPKTPPQGKGSGKTSIRDLLGLDALNLLKDRNYGIFFAASVLICIPLAFYYQHAGQFIGEIGVSNPAGKMTLGQFSEILFMLLLPFFFKRFGFKNTIIVAMLAWFLRYVCFTYGDAGEGVWLVLTGIALHGICYDFFFVSGQIYTDHKAGPAIKSAAQGLITLATYGVGMLIGFWVAGKLTDEFALGPNAHQWDQIWIYPAGFALLVMLLFALLFKNEDVSYEH